MGRRQQGMKRKRENDKQQPNKDAKFSCYNCGGVGHRAQDCPTPSNKGISKYPVLTYNTGIIMIKKTVQGNPKLQNSNITLSGASNEEISVIGDIYTTWDMNNISIRRIKERPDCQI
jgi:hypothetical protein